MSKYHCYLCASDEGILLDIFGDGGKTFRENIETCLSVKIKQSDAPSIKICHKCAWELDCCGKFVQKYKQSRDIKESRASTKQANCILCHQTGTKNRIFELRKGNALNNFQNKIFELFNENFLKGKLENLFVCLDCRYNVDVLFDLKNIYKTSLDKFKSILENGVQLSDLPRTRTRIVSRKTTEIPLPRLNSDSTYNSDTSTSSAMSSKRKRGRLSKDSVNPNTAHFRTCEECSTSVEHGIDMYRFHRTGVTVCRECWLTMDPEKMNHGKRKRLTNNRYSTKLCAVFLKDVLSNPSKYKNVYKMEKDKHGNTTFLITDDSSEHDETDKSLAQRLRDQSSPTIVETKKPAKRIAVGKNETEPAKKIKARTTTNETEPLNSRLRTRNGIVGSEISTITTRTRTRRTSAQSTSSDKSIIEESEPSTSKKTVKKLGRPPKGGIIVSPSEKSSNRSPKVDTVTRRTTRTRSSSFTSQETTLPSNDLSIVLENTRATRETKLTENERKGTTRILSASLKNAKSDSELEKTYTCTVCRVSYKNKLLGMAHQLTHAKQPEVKLERVVIPEIIVKADLPTIEKTEQQSHSSSSDHKNEEPRDLLEDEKPRDSKDEKPRNSKNDKPRNSKHKKPRNSEDAKPRNSEDEKPRNSEDEKSLNSEDEKPRNSKRKKPRNSEDAKPRNSEDEKSLNSEDEKPRNSEDEKPRNSENEKSRNSEDEKPRNSEKEKLRNSKNAKPRNSEDEKSHNSEDEKSRNSENEKSRNSEDEKPRNSEKEKLRNSKNAKPHNSEDEKSHNSEDEKPHNSEDEKPHNSDDEKPRNSEVTVSEESAPHVVEISRDKENSKVEKSTEQVAQVEEICKKKEDSEVEKSRPEIVHVEGMNEDLEGEETILGVKEMGQEKKDLKDERSKPEVTEISRKKEDFQGEKLTPEVDEINKERADDLKDDKSKPEVTGISGGNENLEKEEARAVVVQFNQDKEDLEEEKLKPKVMKVCGDEGNLKEKSILEISRETNDSEEEKLILKVTEISEEKVDSDDDEKSRPEVMQVCTEKENLEDENLRPEVAEIPTQGTNESMEPEKLPLPEKKSLKCDEKFDEKESNEKDDSDKAEEKDEKITENPIVQETQMTEECAMIKGKVDDTIDENNEKIDENKNKENDETTKKENDENENSAEKPKPETLESSNMMETSEIKNGPEKSESTLCKDMEKETGNVESLETIECTKISISEDSTDLTSTKPQVEKLANVNEIKADGGMDFHTAIESNTKGNADIFVDSTTSQREKNDEKCLKDEISIVSTEVKKDGTEDKSIQRETNEKPVILNATETEEMKDLEDSESRNITTDVIREVFDLANAEVKKRLDKAKSNGNNFTTSVSETLENISREIHDGADMPSLELDDQSTNNQS